MIVIDMDSIAELDQAVEKILRSKLATDVFIYRPDEFARREAESHYFVIDEILGKGKIIYERGARLA